MEKPLQHRIEGYDLIRSLAILVVFLGHSIGNQINNPAALLAIRSLSPGLTMSLLGFISAALLSGKEQTQNHGKFLIKRFTRIYITLELCLLLALTIHAFSGKDVINQHLLLHAMGLSAFFGIFQVENRATVGSGLWFITVINLMYLCFPLLQQMFAHVRGRLHLLLFVFGCTVLNLVMYGTASSWNVIISFGVGVYLGVNGRMMWLTNAKPGLPLLASVTLLAVAALATVRIIPYVFRELLFALYPIAFVPLLFSFAKIFPKMLMRAIIWFASISFEFYILHFYFINPDFGWKILSSHNSLTIRVLVSFCLTLVFSFLVARTAAWLRIKADHYFIT